MCTLERRRESYSGTGMRSRTKNRFLFLNGDRKYLLEQREPVCILERRRDSKIGTKMRCVFWSGEDMYILERRRYLYSGMKA